jgi:hypothetical protein
MYRQMRLRQLQRERGYFPVPKYYAELVALVQTQEAVSTCKCDTCFPRMYRSKL